MTHRLVQGLKMGQLLARRWKLRYNSSSNGCAMKNDDKQALTISELAHMIEKAGGMEEIARLVSPVVDAMHRDGKLGEQTAKEVHRLTIMASTIGADAAYRFLARKFGIINGQLRTSLF
jgi:hypothetical protein